MSVDDVYCSILAAIEAPAIHGHSLDALIGSIFNGGMNGIDPPFMIRVFQADSLSEGLYREVVQIRDGLAAYRLKSIDDNIEVSMEIFDD